MQNIRVNAKKLDENDANAWNGLLDALSAGETYTAFLHSRGYCVYSFAALLRTRPDLYAQVKAARVIGADVLAQEALEISDSEPDAAIAALRVKTRLHVAARYAPEYLGDKIALSVNTVSLSSALNIARQRVIDADFTAEAIPAHVPEYLTELVSTTKTDSYEKSKEFIKLSAHDAAANDAKDFQGKDAPENAELVEISKEYQDL